MLIGGVDVSGNPDGGNYVYMGVVVGLDTKIRSIVRELGLDVLDKNEIHDKKRIGAIIPRLKFDGTSLMAMCAKMDRNRIIGEITGMRKIKRKNVPQQTVYRVYNNLLMRPMMPHITGFAASHGHDLSEVEFQCDGDSKRFLADNHLRSAYKGYAYKLSDVVALGNGRNTEPAGVISLDRTREIRSAMVRELR